MSLVLCNNCGKKFELTRKYKDAYGWHTICPKCGLASDTNKEIELSAEQLKKVNGIQSTVFRLCEYLTEQDLDDNLKLVAKVVSGVMQLLKEEGYTVKFPSVVKDETLQYIKE